MKKGLIIISSAIAAVVIAATAAFSIGYTRENDDAFCASCHTEPESTYYERSIASEAVDLAAFHHDEETRCIDCHSGKGLTGRARAMLLGARDWVAYQSGRYVQPAVTTHPEDRDSCTKCHSFSFLGGEAGEGPSLDGVRGHDGHYHSGRLLITWRIRGGPENACAACHPAHVTMSFASYSGSAVIEKGCKDCHNQLGEGGAGERD